MNMRVRILSAVCALLCVGGSLLLTRCADKSTDPPPDSPKDYVVYGYNFHSTKNLVGYHVQSGVLDTLPLSIRAKGMKVSPDGQRLYVARDDRVSVVDVASRGVILDLPYPSVEFILFSPDGRTVALFPGGLTILRTSDYGVLYRHTAGTNAGAFSNDSKLFYCGYGYSAEPPFRGNLACIEIDSSAILWQRSVRFELGTSMLVSRDNHFLASYWEGWLRIYDMSGDSLLFDHRLGYSDGDMIASLDGTRLYLTAAGNIDIAPAPFTFAVYDIPGNRMLDSVRVPYPGNGWCPASDYIAAGYVAITPDGFVIGERARGGMLLIYNLARPDTAKWLCNRLGLEYLTCQTNP